MQLDYPGGCNLSNELLKTEMWRKKRKIWQKGKSVRFKVQTQHSIAGSEINKPTHKGLKRGLQLFIQSMRNEGAALGAENNPWLKGNKEAGTTNKKSICSTT